MPALKSAARVGMAVVLVAIIAILAIRGYEYGWTGFGARTSTPDVDPAKTLWDWLDLLIVPIVLAVGAFWLEGSRKRAEEHVEQDRQRQQVLDSFFEYVSRMILEGHLLNSQTTLRAANTMLAR